MKTSILSLLIALTCTSNLACAQQGNTATKARDQAQGNPGQFASVGNHSVQGSVRIEMRPEGHFVVFAQDFMSSSGPDLRVVLRDSTGAVPMQIVAPLMKNQGFQEYKLTADEMALAKFDEVSIYCAEFHVDFGIAKLR